MDISRPGVFVFLDTMEGSKIAKLLARSNVSAIALCGLSRRPGAIRLRLRPGC